MTGQEKAKELVDSFFLTIVRDDAEPEIKISHELAKDCALIAVDEIIEIAIGSYDKDHENWWKEVKKEIELL